MNPGDHFTPPRMSESTSNQLPSGYSTANLQYLQSGAANDEQQTTPRMNEINITPSPMRFKRCGECGCPNHKQHSTACSKYDHRTADTAPQVIRSFAGSPGLDYVFHFAGRGQVLLGCKDDAVVFPSHAKALEVATMLFANPSSFCIEPRDL